MKDQHANITAPAPPNPSLDGLTEGACYQDQHTTNEANHPARHPGRQASFPFCATPAGLHRATCRGVYHPWCVALPGRQIGGRQLSRGGAGGPSKLHNLGRQWHAALTLMHPGGHNHGDWLLMVADPLIAI